METTVLLIMGLALLRTTTGFPTNDSKDMEGPASSPPSTQEPSQMSDCDLEALIREVFLGSTNTNCSTSTVKRSLKGEEEEDVPDVVTYSRNCSCVLFKLCEGSKDGEANPHDCASHLKCCDEQYSRAPGIHEVPEPPTPRNCGLRNTEGVGSNSETMSKESTTMQYGEFPWMAAVLRPEKYDNGTVNIYKCAGSLIHPLVVLTGSHCVHGKDNLVVRVGEWNDKMNSEAFPIQDLLVEQVIVHEGFNNGSLANDPALLILEAPVDMSKDNVGLICLPEPNEAMDGRNCVASVWSKDQSSEEGKLEVIMKKVDLPIVPQEPCQEALRNTKLGPHFKLHETFLCAGGVPGQDTCKGDGGSPLVCPTGNSGKYVQAGIVAWGIGCGSATPGVYVNVPFFVDWINQVLEDRGVL